MPPLLLGLDIGKTNLRVATFDADLRLLARWSVPALDLPAGLEQLRQHLHTLAQLHPVRAVGLSIFGPLETRSGHPHFGSLHNSSEPVWNGRNLPALAAEATAAPVFFDYDVNAGALAEATLGAAAGLDDFIYLSLGTGVGAAVYRRGLVPGHAPQLGHMFLPREPDDADFAGSCRFHGACFQGLASGRALAERWGMPAEELLADHPAWDLEARYIARACANLVYTLAPPRILLGSSVGTVPLLAERANIYLTRYLNGFLDDATAERYRRSPPIVRAQLAPDSALLGAAVMARDALGLRFNAVRPAAGLAT